MGWPVAGFHSRTVPPPASLLTLELASILPSGLNATPSTVFWVPIWRGEPMGWPVAGSHSRTVPSYPALARILPSGLNATALTPF